MPAYDLARLFGLALIWSLQFLFLRVAVPVFGGGALVIAAMALVLRR